ncbi:MAG: TraR/DksA family transcriptional regulator [Methylotenera sp.]|nr:TraR/DksA family transcriptional regulator [Oligoflexia bacterium]
MDGNFLMRLRNILVDRRETAAQGIERELDEMHDPQMIPQSEMIDMAQSLEQLDRDTHLHEQERHRMVAIDRALAKMATGTFGQCEDCEEEIPSRRLLAVPEARLCAKCQAVEERQQGRMRGPAVMSRAS